MSDDLPVTPVAAALMGAETLANSIPDLSLLRLAQTLPVRARDALVGCLLCAPLLAGLVLWAPGGQSGFWPFLFALLCASLVLFAGLRTSGIWRALKLRSQLKAREQGRPTRIIDLTGFAEPCVLVATSHARGYRTTSLRLHDHPGTAISSALTKAEMPSWWSSAKPEFRDVYFDGYAVRRAGPVRPASGVLLEAAVEAPGLERLLPAGEPVRLLGDEGTAVVFTRDTVIWPRGRWLAGG